MFLRIGSMALLLCGVATMSKADTSLNQANACFQTMLDEAKNGASFSSMVESYIAFSAVAARAVHFQKQMVWNDLSRSEQDLYIEAIHAYFDKEADKVNRNVGANEYVVLDTVTLQPRYHKKVKGGYQLAGIYQTQGGSTENFALHVVQTNGRCYIYDARWRDAWLSKYVSLP